MSAKNLISVLQLRQDELLAYIDYAIESLPVDTGIASLTGLIGSKKVLNLVNQSIVSGVTQVQVSYPAQPTIPAINFQLNTSGSSDPILLSNVDAKTFTGCLVQFSDKTYSPNYYFDLMISV